MRKLWYRFIVGLTIKLLHRLDENMKRAGWPRWRRRQFWRDFIKGQRAEAIALLKKGME